MIKLELDVRASSMPFVRCYIKNRERYTYDPKCVPPRIVDIREVIGTLDTQIESEHRRSFERDS